MYRFEFRLGVVFGLSAFKRGRSEADIRVTTAIGRERSDCLSTRNVEETLASF